MLMGKEKALLLGAVFTIGKNEWKTTKRIFKVLRGA